MDKLLRPQVPVRQSESAKGVRCRMSKLIAEIGFESRRGHCALWDEKRPEKRSQSALVP